MDARAVSGSGTPERRSAAWARLCLLAHAVRRRPRLVGAAARVGWRNLTSLFDYALARGRSLPPKGLTFRVSGRCDLACRMCIYRNGGFLDGRGLLSRDLFEKAIDGVRPGRPFVAFTGGEPLLHPEIAGFIARVKERGMCCNLVTNGWSLARRAPEIAASGLDSLVVSIDGPEEVHDEIRGRPGSYRRALAGIREVLRFERRPLLFISASIQADSCDHLGELARVAAHLGVDALNVQALWSRPPERAAAHNRAFPAYPVRDGWADESLLRVDFCVLEEALREARATGLPVNLFPPLSLRRLRTWYSDPAALLANRRLKCAWMMLNVFHDGTVRVCDDVVVGDLRDEGVREIWNGERMVGFRRALRGNGRFPICAGCCSAFRDYLV